MGMGWGELPGKSPFSSVVFHVCKCSIFTVAHSLPPFSRPLPLLQLLLSQSHPRLPAGPNRKQHHLPQNSAQAGVALVNPCVQAAAFSDLCLRFLSVK